MINSKQKGKRGEREFARFLIERGIEARRGVQYKGAPDSPDVISELENIHIEVKFRARISPYDEIRQAKSDCGDKIPIVAHKQNYRPWLVIMEAEDWVKMARKVYGRESSLDSSSEDTGNADGRHRSPQSRF